MNGRGYDNLILDLQWSSKCLSIPGLACSNLFKLSLDQIGALVFQLIYYSPHFLISSMPSSLLANFRAFEKAPKTESHESGLESPSDEALTRFRVS